MTIILLQSPVTTVPQFPSRTLLMLEWKPTSAQKQPKKTYNQTIRQDDKTGKYVIKSKVKHCDTVSESNSQLR